MENNSGNKSLKKLPVGIQSFSEMVDGGYVYADKTQYIYNLERNGKHYFLSRPRRFGKSLLVDTMKELFEGNRRLFSGLWIDKSDYDFDKYPVIKLDLTKFGSSSPEKVEEGILKQMQKIAADNGLQLSSRSPEIAFDSLIDDLYEKYEKQVVVLIDEYDKPVIDHLDDAVLADANRKTLASIYGILKGQDSNLKFVFITGVSKYTKMSIFSKLNNLIDLTLFEDYAGICGITESEFQYYFMDYVEDYKKYQKSRGRTDGEKSVEELTADIFRWYDGYSWDGETRVFNPFSLLNFFLRNTYAYYWYDSGTPTFLYKSFKDKPITFADIQGSSMLETDLNSHEIEDASIISLLFQTGFLTVKKTLDEHPPRYIVGMPNIEVSQSMSKQFIESVIQSGTANNNAFISQISSALNEMKPAVIEDCLTGLYASIPYLLQLPYEAYYQTIFLCVMQFLGFKTSAEVSVAGGRIDGTLDLINDISYVIEFKYNKTPDDALPDDIERLLETGITDAFNQIEERGYAGMYAGRLRRVYKLAVSVAGKGNVRVRLR